MVALYDYDPQTDSPNDNPELELSFRVGDTLTVYGNIVSEQPVQAIAFNLLTYEHVPIATHNLTALWM